ncbi:hypothetical protein ACFS6H_13110 [Terrimonas rubra]|uniref:Uncharacterized protein n=1 Tax=Terrimonas rubra TaxID=1035890 RepID=A0ABW6A8B5_9BACT
MPSGNPHLLKRPSLFAMFCLSYLPLLFLLIVKVMMANRSFLYYAGFNKESIITFTEKFGFVIILVLLSLYAIIGTKLTLANIKRIESNAFPVTISSIKPKNEEALSYLATYVLPLLAQGQIGYFEYIAFVVLFGIYYKLYATSSLILINPILNLKYGLYEVEYLKGDTTIPKSAMIISENKWINEEDDLQIVKLSHRLYFAY